MLNIKIETSAHHVHLKKEDVEKLFGEGYELTEFKKLSQPGEFAANEMVAIRTEKGLIEKVRILGPVRSYSQAEISKTESYKLGLKPLTRESGDLENTSGAVLVGPKGEVVLEKGVILAYRHIHASTEQAQDRNLKHGQLVSVKVAGSKGLIFENVMVKVRDSFDWHMHIDTDEANAAGVDMENNIGEVII